MHSTGLMKYPKKHFPPPSPPQEEENSPSLMAPAEQLFPVGTVSSRAEVNRSAAQLG